MRDQYRALAGGERRPVPLDDANPALKRRHRPLAAPGPIQRAGHRYWTGGGEVGLGATTGPAVHLAVDEHERQVHIAARECLFGDCALGLGEQHVQFAFEVFESTRSRRFVLLQQGADALGELFERSPAIARCRFVDQRMGYFHWGNPPQCSDLAISIVAEDHCPVLPPQPARRDKLSPVLLHSYIGVFHKSLEFDHLYVVLDVSSRSTPMDCAPPS